MLVGLETAEGLGVSEVDVVIFFAVLQLGDGCRCCWVRIAVLDLDPPEAADVDHIVHLLQPLRDNLEFPLELLRGMLENTLHLGVADYSVDRDVGVDHEILFVSSLVVLCRHYYVPSYLLGLYSRIQAALSLLFFADQDHNVPEPHSPGLKVGDVLFPVSADLGYFPLILQPMPFLQILNLLFLEIFLSLHVDKGGEGQVVSPFRLLLQEQREILLPAFVFLIHIVQRSLYFFLDVFLGHSVIDQPSHKNKAGKFYEHLCCDLFVPNSIGLPVVLDHNEFVPIDAALLPQVVYAKKYVDDFATCHDCVVD